MSLVDPRQWLLAVAFLGAAVLGINFWEARLVAQGDAAGYARAQGEYRTKLDEATAKAAADTQALQAHADQIRKDKTREIDTVTAQRDTALERLRHRPERPATPSHGAPAGAGQTAPGCTGAQLYRPDAEFLVREAARADTIRIELEACYSQYDRARALTLE